MQTESAWQMEVGVRAQEDAYNVPAADKYCSSGPLTTAF